MNTTTERAARKSRMFAHATVMARRRTFDGVLVQFWTDGAITVGHEMQNRIVARGLPIQMMFLIAGEICVYNADEIRALVKAARKVLDKHDREPYRVRDVDLLPLMRAYAPRLEERS